jgi:hypothetical protein
MVDHAAVAAIWLLIGVRWINSHSAVTMWFGVSIVWALLYVVCGAVMFRPVVTSVGLSWAPEEPELVLGFMAV